MSASKMLVDPSVHALAEHWMRDYDVPPHNLTIDRKNETQEFAEVIQRAIEEHLEWAESQGRLKEKS